LLDYLELLAQQTQNKNRNHTRLKLIATK